MKIDYQNDIVFKKTLGDDDSVEFLNYFIHTYTGLEFSDYEVTNKENLGKFIESKKNYLDIRAKNSKDEVALIEMQKGHINQLGFHRFVDYPGNELVNQISQGDDYTKLKGVIEIIVTPDKAGNKFVSTYKLRDQDGDIYPSDLLTIIIVSLGNLKLEKYDSQELIGLAYQKGNIRDIMELTKDQKLKEMLRHMEDKYQETISNSIFKTEAQAAAFYEASKRQTEIELTAKGRVEGKIEEKINSVHLLMKNMNIPLEKALEILEMSIEEYNQYKN